MLHVSAVQPVKRRALVTRRRFQLAGAILFGVGLPILLRLAMIMSPIGAAEARTAVIANLLAVLITFWARYSIETYPGIRASAVILSTTTAAFGAMFSAVLLSRWTYARLELLLGYVFTLGWNYACYFLAQRSATLSIAVVPFGDVERLSGIERVFWFRLPAPVVELLGEFDAVVADFNAELPDEWERFLADAALHGKIVYHVKHLSESLTGRVEIAHLSENAFGSLIPARGYFHLKAIVDWLVALALLPLALPVLALAGLAIKLDDGGPVLFRQERVGHAGRPIRVTKLRTMRPMALSQLADDDHGRRTAMTGEFDPRITRVGSFLRRTRLDELPQIWNVLRGEMSWIGPRPEAAVLSVWYTAEIPFYRYRHVVKPGISGWAQVNQGHVADVEEVGRKLQYDFYYIKYFSPWLDLLIVFKTIRTVMNGFGSK